MDVLKIIPKASSRADCRGFFEPQIYDCHICMLRTIEMLDIHLKTLIEMWIICLYPVSANSEKGRGSGWAGL